MPKTVRESAVTAQTDHPGENRELLSAIAASRGLLVAVAIFSVFANLLMLTGPLFMLQVYDRVLASGSIETLTALFLLVTGMFLIFGLLDFARGRLMGRVGARSQTLLGNRADDIAMTGTVSGTRHVLESDPRSAPRDLTALQKGLAGSAPFVFFDLPWVPVFLAAMFVFHPWLGILGCAGGLVMIAVTALNQWRTRAALEAAQGLDQHASRLSDAAQQDAGVIKALGMKGAVLNRLGAARQEALAAGITASDRSGAYTSASKSLRFYLQSAILALGAALAIAGDITPGAMIAASILMGRALAPVEQGIAQWPTIQRCLSAWRRLKTTLTAFPAEPKKTELPQPQSRLEARNLTVKAPGADALNVIGLNFDLEPGEAMGVIGRSASGKSSLARALANIWGTAAGTIRLDGATYDQWPADALGAHIGYLPQDVTLMSGTVAENIARMQQPVDARRVITATKSARAHEMILRLPQGYETPVGDGGSVLSGGQRQRIGLARALFGNPALVILDEPNAHLDSDGEDALIETITDLKNRDKAVIVMAHRPNGIAACDTLLVLDKGRQRAWGPRDEILQQFGKPRAPADDDSALRQATVRS